MKTDFIAPQKGQVPMMWGDESGPEWTQNIKATVRPALRSRDLHISNQVGLRYAALSGSCFLLWRSVRISLHGSQALLNLSTEALVPIPQHDVTVIVAHGGCPELVRPV